MTPTSIPLVDQAALLLWRACVQFGLFGTVLLIPIGIAHRRPAARHFLASAATAAGVDRQEPVERPAAEASRPAAPDPTPKDARSPDDLVRALAARSANWIAPPASLETLEYDFVSGAAVTPVKVTRGQRRRYSVWMGATLHAGFRELMKSPEKFAIEVKPGTDARALTLVARVKDGKEHIGVEVGNGVENSWSGYFSHPARGTSIVVDAERLLPIEEQTGPTTIRYSDWQEVGPEKWVPRRIDAIGRSAHYRMHFAWLGDSVWLLRSSESISPEGTVTPTRTRNERVNGRDVVMPATDAERRSQEAARALRSMLDCNRTWLDGGATGSGWRPPFETLSYTFHTVREDVRETCVLDRGGEAAFEVTGDGLGKMKDRLGNRSIALNSREYASSERGARFARLHGRPERERDQPFDLALKHYARIGCQLDLPLFRYRERLDFATVNVEEGTWNGRPHRIAIVSNLGGVFLGCGTMLAFSSWSYVHHIGPSKEVIYIDPDRNVPVHETLTSSRDARVFEIDFADYVEVEPGQWAPRSIRIEAKDYFTCEYQFQLVAGKHWMLKEVVSWFKPDEKSRGVVEDARIDGDRDLLDDALRQVEASRTLFKGAGEPDRQVDVAAVPFSLGRATRIGPYEVLVTVQDRWRVVVSVSTNDPAAADTVPLCFLDEGRRPLFAPSVTLTAHEGARRGSVAMRGTRAWRDVRSIAVPAGDATAARLPVRVAPFRWGEPLSVNIPDAAQGKVSPSGDKEPRAALTRAFRVRGERADDGTARLTLDVVSIDGTHEFYLDLAVGLLGESGELLSSGHLSTSLRVESKPVEKPFEIVLGKVPEGIEPRFVAIGIAPGDVTSAPMGSAWLSMGPDPPFDIAVLLAAPDEGSRRIGLTWLDNRERNYRIHEEFLGDRLDDRLVGDGPLSRRTLLRPHAEALVRILREPGAADAKAGAARFLAYSEADGTAGALEPLAADPAPQVREAVAIGLTFLGRAGHLDFLRPILKREITPRQAGVPIAERASTQRLVEDTLIALAHQGSDDAVDLLGETLLADLEDLRPVPDPRGETSLVGRAARATDVCTLLGRTGNPRAVRWLTSAADLIARRPDLAEHFDRSTLARSMLRFKEQTKGRIAAELESGTAAAVWAYVLRDSRDPDFIPAIRELLRRKDVTVYAMGSGVDYLWNLDSPEAVGVLREAYDRGIMRDEPRQWLRLCEALAASGDGRGLADAFEVLVGLKRPAEPPAEEKERKQWESAREHRLREAEAVFERASKEILDEFLLRRTEADSPAERQVVLRLLWRLPELPEPFAAIVPRWAKGADPQVAETARHLLDRD